MTSCLFFSQSARISSIDRELAFVRQVLFPVEHLFEHEVGIAAEQNVGAAAGHVRGDGHGALASGLGDDFRFAFVLLGVEHVVLDAVPAQHSRRVVSDFSIEMVPTSTGWPRSWHSLISSTIAANFSFSVR